MSDPKIVNQDDVEWMERSHGEFAGRAKLLGRATAGERLGASLYEVPPGHRSVPYHYHTGNEEAIYVLDGSGTLRLDGEEHGISAGDYVALPVGEPGAHQVHNTSEEPVRYLCFSTMEEPDAIVYPDSSKVSIMAGAAPGGPREEITYSTILDEEAEMEYWDREG